MSVRNWPKTAVRCRCKNKHKLPLKLLIANDKLAAATHGSAVFGVHATQGLKYTFQSASAIAASN